MVALAALRARALDRGGAAAAFAVGSLSFLGALFGWNPPGTAAAIALILAFFLTSVALSRAGRARKSALDVPKEGARKAIQVFANGGVATLCALAAACAERGSHAATVLLWGFGGAYAAATADTWATEIGSAFGGVPRSIANLRTISPGLSGGMTALGTAAMVAGAAWIGAVFALIRGNLNGLWVLACAGVAGGIADSLLGATVQRLHRCPACGRDTETEIHRCGTPALRVRGFAWMTNDAVNLAATAIGALVAGALSALAP